MTTVPLTAAAWARSDDGHVEVFWSDPVLVEGRDGYHRVLMVHVDGKLTRSEIHPTEAPVTGRVGVAYLAKGTTVELRADRTTEPLRLPPREEVFPDGRT